MTTSSNNSNNTNTQNIFLEPLPELNTKRYYTEKDIMLLYENLSNTPAILNDYPDMEVVLPKSEIVENTQVLGRFTKKSKKDVDIVIERLKDKIKDLGYGRKD